MITLALVLIALAAALVPVPASFVESAYSRGFYLRIQAFTTSLSNALPLAFVDAFLIVVVVALTLSLVRTWRTRGLRPALVRTLARVTGGAATVYLMFLASWGLNYRRVPLESKLDFDRGRVSQQAALDVATQATDQLNRGHALAHAQPFLHDRITRSLADVESMLGAPRAAVIGAPKRSLLQWYFRYAAIDGMTVPVVLEVILNPDLLPVEMPFTYAHEQAHLAGYADESEANFVSWIACVRSGDPLARYSAWMDAYRLAINALPRDAHAVLPRLEDGPRQDFRDIAARYQRSSPRVREAARGVYDSYLKANRIEEGIDNYELVLQLILGTRFGADWSPRMR